MNRINVTIFQSVISFFSLFQISYFYFFFVSYDVYEFFQVH